MQYSRTCSKLIISGKEKAQHAADNASEIKDALSRIVSEAQHVQSIAETVSISTREQCDAISHVTQRIADISDMANQNVTGAEQIGIATKHIAASAQNMDKVIARYKVAD